MFLSRRAVHWQTVGNCRRAASACVLAFSVSGLPAHASAIKLLAESWQAKLHARMILPFPVLQLTFDPTHPRWPRIPWEFEHRLRYLETLENVLNDREFERDWWAPLRAGRPLRTPMPSPIRLDCTGDSQRSIRP